MSAVASTPRGGPREPFNPLKVSPSRLNAYSTCGVAFKRQYIDREPQERSGSAALFGNVVHKALEGWALNRQSSLVSHMRAAWLSETEGTIVNDFVGAYGALSVKSIRAKADCHTAYEARTKKKTSDSGILMTKEWKSHPVKQQLGRLLAEWIPKLNNAPWLFTERDPLFNLYDESLILAARYQHKHRDRPPAVYSELAFDVKWAVDPDHPFLLNGFIDAIETVVDADGRATRIDVVDYKTYRVCDAEAKDWRQGVIYDVALRHQLSIGAVELPGVYVGPTGTVRTPINVVFDYPRLDKRRRYVMMDTDRGQLGRELLMYYTGVSGGVFMPAEKNRNPDYCDYPSSCCLRNRGDCAMPIEEVF